MEKLSQAKTSSRHFLDRRPHDYNTPQSHGTPANKSKVGIKAPNLDQVFQLDAAVRDYTMVIRTALLQPSQSQSEYRKTSQP